MFSEAGFLYFQSEEKLHHLCLWVFHCELHPSTDNSNIVIINDVKIIADLKCLTFHLQVNRSLETTFLGTTFTYLVILMQYTKI